MSKRKEASRQSFRDSSRSRDLHTTDFASSRARSGSHGSQSGRLRSRNHHSRSRSSTSPRARRRSFCLTVILDKAADKRTEWVFSHDDSLPVRTRSHRSSRSIDASPTSSDHSPKSSHSRGRPRYRSSHDEEYLNKRSDLLVPYDERHFTRILPTSSPHSRRRVLNRNSYSDGAVNERTDFSTSYRSNSSLARPLTRSPSSGRQFRDHNIHSERDNIERNDTLLSHEASISSRTQPPRSGTKVDAASPQSRRPSRSSHSRPLHPSAHLEEAVDRGSENSVSRDESHLPSRNPDTASPQSRPSLGENTPSIECSESNRHSAHLRPPTINARLAEDGDLHRGPSLTKRVPSPSPSIRRPLSRPTSSLDSSPIILNYPSPSPVNNGSVSEQAVSPPITDDCSYPPDLSENVPSNETKSEPSFKPFPSPPSSDCFVDKAHQYSKLQASGFRLIRILPAKMSIIQCEIFDVSLDDPNLPAYVALSYAWGDAGDTEKIELQGTPFSVTVSLHDALDALREGDDKEVLVWADALCIDQQNKNERTQQVRLMTNIYSRATSVTIWLGKESHDSVSATESLKVVAETPELVTSLIPSVYIDLAAIASLFGRDYWKRLWVVQEILNSVDTKVYCGSSKLPWSTYKVASEAFLNNKAIIDKNLPVGLNHEIGQDQYTLSQVLAYQGPGSLPDRDSLKGREGETLLHVMRKCRRKLCSDPKDKVFGILGVLQRDEVGFKVDYDLSVKEVYINVVDSLLHTTNRLDVICEAFHFPVHTNTSSASLPSWAPDWSHSPATTALGREFEFSAAGDTEAVYRFVDKPRRNKLEISAVFLGTIKEHGIAVGTLCKLADYLMAFLHWRALLLSSELMKHTREDRERFRVEKAFCKTLCLDQVRAGWKSRHWVRACYHVFASSIRKRLPHMPLDQELQGYVDVNWDVELNRAAFLNDNFGKRMMGRCFCLTDGGHMGMGSGFMENGDVVVVPLGCHTPVILRECSNGEHRFVGDVYINGYMQGKAIENWESGHKELRKYVLH